MGWLKYILYNIIFIERNELAMKTINSQQEEYRAFLKNIREEREESSNLARLVITVVMAILCAVIVCVILVENNLIFDSSKYMNEDTAGVFKFKREEKKTFDVPFSPKRQKIITEATRCNECKGRPTCASVPQGYATVLCIWQWCGVPP
mgnify:CR=1 FL=1